MSALKILSQVNSCGECPNYVYYSGGVHRCSLVDENILDKSIVAPFCPLPDFPSSTIASMQKTILGLRETNTYGFDLALMTHIATKLKLNLYAKGSGLTIAFTDHKQEREVYLSLDYITNIQIRPFEITFTSGGGTFKLSPDESPPLLREAADGEGNLWHRHSLW